MLRLGGALMGRPRKPPAYLVGATVRRSAKLAALPNDEARLGFFYVVLAEAKLVDPPGQYESREHFRELAGRFAAYLEDYIRVGILETAGKLCKRCAAAWSAMPPKRLALVVHDWHEHQYDPRKVERQREYEERQRELAEADAAEVSDAVSDGISDAKPDEFPTQFPTPISHAPVTPARPEGAHPDASNVERRTTNGISHGEDSPRSGVREDIAALHERGWTKVTRAQRKVLNEIAERHDVTGHGFAAAAIRAAGPDRDPLEAAMTADRMWQDAQRQRAEAEETAWAAAKAQERADADHIAWLRDEAKA